MCLTSLSDDLHVIRVLSRDVESRDGRSDAEAAQNVDGEITTHSVGRVQKLPQLVHVHLPVTLVPGRAC